MYWKLGTSRIAAPTIPMLTMGADFDLSLTLITEASEDLDRVILCCLRGADAGLIQAKKATNATYHAIGILFDSECFLGGIAAETETVIDFRVNLPVGSTAGSRTIPIVLLYGDLIQGPCTAWQVTVASPWQDPDDSPIWRDPREV